MTRLHPEKFSAILATLEDTMQPKGKYEHEFTGIPPVSEGREPRDPQGCVIALVLCALIDLAILAFAAHQLGYL